ncbi:MAG TPA: RdgB/HAM1 family non-canonical purine NTP pyrophosphatase [Iamia sp.]
MKLVLATANPHKTTEIRSILATAGVAVELVPRPDDVPDVVEDAPDLEGNARLKAAALAAATGLPALSDDTGLEVDALDGRPGVRSARYAGEDGDAAANVAKLLDELAAVPSAGRTARFRTVAMVRWPDGRELAAEGVVEGVIAPAPRGDGGFGYDPVFLAEEGRGLSFAEMDAAAKDAISHRGRALRALAALLASGVT